jgi:hypothetical protein
LSAVKDRRIREKKHNMSDIPVYMVVNLTVEDTEKYRIYEKGFFSILKNMGEVSLHMMIILKL